MKGGIRGEKPLISEFGRPNSVLAAATQDCCLVLGVGYDCSQIQPAEKKNRGLLPPVALVIFVLGQKKGTDFLVPLKDIHFTISILSFLFNKSKFLLLSYQFTCISFIKI